MPEIHGDELIRQMLEEIREEDELAAAFGVDLTPPAPSAEHAPRIYAPLAQWLTWSDEAHEVREAAWRAERSKRHENTRSAFRPQNHDVRFVVVGGQAGVLRQAIEFSYDLDILIEATEENARRVCFWWSTLKN